jgi:integrase
MGRQKNPNGVGSYRKRADGRFEWRQTIDGKPRSIKARTFKELQEKVKKVADLPIIAEKYKADEWFEKWLNIYVKPLKSEATYEQYYFIYTAHIKPVLGNRKLSSLKSYDIQEVISKMNEKELSTWTMKHARKVMSIALAKAEKDKVIPKSPVVDIEIPTKQPKTKKTLTTDELAKIFKAMSESRWIWSVRFDLVTGLRRGELLALTWADIDWENKRINIDKSLSMTRKKKDEREQESVKVGQTKSAKQRWVALSNKAAEYLKKQKEMLEAECNKNTELVFPSYDHKPMPPNSYYTMLARFAAKAGIKASPHCLRHTFVYMMRKKLTLKELQYVLGHEESTQTLDIYGDLINDDTAEIAAHIDAVFEESEQPDTPVNSAKVINLFDPKMTQKIRKRS